MHEQDQEKDVFVASLAGSFVSLNLLSVDCCVTEALTDAHTEDHNSPEHAKAF